MPRRDEYAAERSLFRPGSDLVRSVVLSGFEPTPRLGAEAWRSGCDAVCAHRLAGVALDLVEAGDDAVPPEVAERLRTAAFHQAAYSVAVLQGSGDLLDALDAARIRYVISKGLGIADLGQGVRSRPFSDIDVIVGPSQYATVLDLCAGHGYTEAAESRQTWEWIGRHAREAINLRNTSGGSVDVHQTIPPWYWGTGLTFDLLEGEVRPVTYGGRTYRCLSAEANLLIVALHVVSDKNRPGATLMVWRDLLVLMRACDPGRLRLLADRSGTAGWLRWIVEQLPEDAVAPDVLDAVRTAPVEVSGGTRLSLLLPPRIGSRHLLSQPLRLPPARAAAYIAGSVIPSPGFLRAHYGPGVGTARAYLEWWRHGLSSFRREPGTDT